MVAESLEERLPKVSFAFDAHGRGSWRVREFDLHEEIGAPYHCDLDLVSVEPDADVAGLLNATVTLEILREGMVRRRIHGVIFRVVDQGTAHDHVSVHVEMAPALWLASYGTNTRIFQKMTAPQIIQEVLKEPLFVNHRICEARLDYQHYIEREFCVQYQESDLDFVHRLMQEEGISYFFDQTGEYKHGQYEKLVLVDCNEAFPKCETLDRKAVPVAAYGAVAGHVETLHSLTASRELGPNRAVVHNFEWTRPWFNFMHMLKKKEGDGPDLEIYDHTPFHMVSKYSHDEAKYTDDETPIQQRARIRLEEAQVRQKLCKASGNVTGLAAGMVFEAVARDAGDLDGKYLVHSVRHVGRSDEDLAEPGQAQGPRGEDFRNWLACIPMEVPYRPARVIRPPVVKGLVTATVVGQAGQEVDTDGHGRVKVQFHWDREGKRDEKSSCWVRVAQAWAGPMYGTMFIPRIGMEVVVQFIEGDPDRPLIIGCVYNGVNTPAHSLLNCETKSWIRTASSPKGGFNEICFEDRKGGEEVYIHSQGIFTEEVESDHHLTVMGEQIAKIHADRKLFIDSNSVETILGSETTTIKHDRSTTIKGRETTLVEGDRSETVQGSETRVVDRAQTVVIDGSQQIFINGYQSMQVGSSVQPREVVVSVEGKHTTLATQSIRLISDEKIILECGKTRLMIGPEQVVIDTKQLVFRAQESVELRSKGIESLMTDKLEVTGKTLNFYADQASLELSSNADLNGQKVNLNCGGGSASEQSDDKEEAKTRPINLQLHDDDMKPLANKRYRLIIAGLRLEGTTDGSGAVIQTVPEDAQFGLLTVWLTDDLTGPRMNLELHLRNEALPPAKEVSGALLRLRNLGYYTSPDVATLTSDLSNALRSFQADNDLETSGEPDSKTSSKLMEIHGS